MSRALRARWLAWRETRLLRDRAIPDELWLLTMARYPFLGWRSLQDVIELRRLATLFLAQKEFTGAGGFSVSDEVAVAVAAQACLPILRLGLEPYRGFIGIVMHADEVMARREFTDEDGIVHEYEEALTGEAMDGGPVTLSWRDVADAGDSARWGYNVVVHEFAHVLDMTDGLANGMPLLCERAVREAWSASVSSAFAAHVARVERGQQTLLDPYGAESIDEFFAVASEAFFVAPHDLIEEHSSLYELLAGYYLQNPAAHSPQ